jgi:hypothetical protein
MAIPTDRAPVTSEPLTPSPARPREPRPREPRSREQGRRSRTRFVVHLVLLATFAPSLATVTMITEGWRTSPWGRRSWPSWPCTWCSDDSPSPGCSGTLRVGAVSSGHQIDSRFRRAEKELVAQAHFDQGHGATTN